MTPAPEREADVITDDLDDIYHTGEPCHRCGSTRQYGQYGRAYGPLGVYVVCECGCLLTLSPDNEGLSDAEAAICDAGAAKILAWHRLPSRARWLTERRERRRMAPIRRERRKLIDKVIAEMLKGGRHTRHQKRGPIHVTSLTDSEWL